MTKLGIIGAMELEVESLISAMGDKTCRTVAGSGFYEGTLEGLPVVVVRCGVGKVNAALCAQILIDRFSITHLVNTGVAGSLNAKLDIGDLVISTDAMYHDFTVEQLGYAPGQVPGMDVLAFPADEALSNLAFAAAEAVNPGHTHRGRVATGDQFVAEKGKKEAIIAATGAVCTEMEGGAIAQTAYRNGIPFAILRAISDKADDSAEMDYPTFEAIAARHCAQVTSLLAKRLC